MTLDEILASLFPDGHDVKPDHGVVFGSASLRSGHRALVIGVADRTPVGVDEAIRLSAHVLDSLGHGSGPIFVLVDSDSQRLSKRDELLGLNEFLAHLAKSLIYADMNGRPTIGISTINTMTQRRHVSIMGETSTTARRPAMALPPHISVVSVRST